MKFITAVVTISLLLGCVSTSYKRNQKNKHYNNKNYSYSKEGAIISLMPFTNDVFHLNDLNLNSKQEMDRVIDTAYKYIFKGIKDSIKSMKTVEMNSSINNNIKQVSTKYYSILKRFGSERIPYKYYAPTKAYRSEIGIKANVLFILNKLDVSKEEKKTYSRSAPVRINGSMMSQGISTSYKYYLYEADVQFMVFDCKRNKIISCGKFKTKIDVDKGYETLFKKIGRKMGAKSPYKKKRPTSIF